MAHIRRQLLEYLIRECVREVLDQVDEEDDTIGAPSPPAAGLGTADQPALPKVVPSELPSVPPKKGVVLVNPRDKSKLLPVPFRYTNDAQLERDLFRLGAALAGSKVKTSLNAMKMVRDSVRNPSMPVYLFVGKYDPESEEIFMMADRDLNTAKENSIPPSELIGPFLSAPSNVFEPLSAEPGEFAARLASGGKIPRREVDELKKAIKRMVKEIFSE